MFRYLVARHARSWQEHRGCDSGETDTTIICRSLTQEKGYEKTIEEVRKRRY
jgi:hypothetical protein